MSILDIIKKRYAVRKYSDRQVEPEKLEQILTAANCAPTAANRQAYKIFAVQKPENLEKFDKKDTFSAPLVLLVCSDVSKIWVRPYDGKNMVDIDASIITDHMMLTATELELGSCWITYFDPEAVRKAFDLPEHLIPVNILAVGYSADDQPKSPDRHAQTRKSLDETVVYL